jgi:hypothetical protein
MNEAGHRALRILAGRSPPRTLVPGTWRGCGRLVTGSPPGVGAGFPDFTEKLAAAWWFVSMARSPWRATVMREHPGPRHVAGGGVDDPWRGAELSPALAAGSARAVDVSAPGSQLPPAGVRPPATAGTCATAKLDARGVAAGRISPGRRVFRSRCSTSVVPRGTLLTAGLVRPEASLAAGGSGDA